MKYKAFHKLSYGLYIIATCHDDTRAGYIGNTVFQVTSSPPQIAISCNKKNETTGKILQSKKFSVSVLEKGASTSLIGEFGFMSSAELDKFRNVETITAVTGAPVVIDSTLAWFDCKVVATADVGTHILIIGLVQDCDILSDDEPLTYDHYREKYKMLAPKNAPTYIAKENLTNEEGAINKGKASGKQIKKQSKNGEAEIYTCSICGYQYNPDAGDPKGEIPPGKPFEELPEDYKCPVCNADKKYFKIR